MDPIDVGHIVKRRIVKKFQFRHVSKAKRSGQFPLDKPLGALKSSQEGLFIMRITMGGKVNLSNPQITAQGHAGNGGLGQSRVVDAFLNKVGQYFLHLTADSFRSIE